MRLLRAALVVVVSLVTVDAFAETTEIPPVKIVVKPARPLVTEVAAPQKSLLIADPPPSFTGRVAEPVARSPF